MKTYNLSPFVLPVGLDGDVAAGTDGARVTSLAVIDTLDCESVVFVIQLGAVVATGVVTAWVKQSADSGAFGAGTVGDVSVKTNVAGLGDDKCLIIEVRRPTQRYLRLDYQRTVANATFLNIFALKNLNRDVRDTEVAGRLIANSPEPATA